MNGDDAPHSIGDLARLTGLTVKTLRAWSDRGIVPPSGRTPAGHRRYGPAAVARLRTVRALRDLGLGLDAARAVADGEAELSETAAAHADALTAQITALRHRHALLLAIARRGSGTAPDEAASLIMLATLPDDERRRLVAQFLDSVLDGSACRGRDDPAVAGYARTLTPELPLEPEPAQLAAWAELAQLLADPDFRAMMRRAVDHQLAESAAARRAGPVPRPGTVAVVRAHAAPALAAGTAPGSRDAGRIVEAVAAQRARDLGRHDGPALRHLIRTGVDAARDPRRDRCLRLLATVNGWQQPESPAAQLDWFADAMRAHTPA
ncbi:MerR family transcriptional regulator [Streptomyces sp. NPDC049879]|uniref:helix-turn-helix domain-containing protein n=1 Tax=Streptomyces sp. NPDC049879 TaxID=3365598 RepID=UPI00378E4D5F